ncbi:MAG TPA: hypothetical protein VG028_05750 [Terriglobia bacterium]|nr:hypothetical protein [Terriglobia bacterium]
MKLKKGGWIPILIMVLCVPGAAPGQQTAPGDQQTQPVAPVTSDQSAQVAEEGQTTPLAPDPRSFSGAEEVSVQSPGTAHSYFLPSFEFSENGDSNLNFGTGPQKFETMSSIMGRLDLQRAGRFSTTTAEFIGGGSIYTHRTEFNSTSEQFGISHSYQGRRWSFLLDDRASYLPESPFGYGGLGFMGALGTSLGGANGSNLASLNPAFSADETLLTGRGSRILNTAVVQTQYKAGAHSAITMTGSFGLLHFRAPGFTDTRSGNVLFGFNHSFTARDNVGISYGYSLYRYKHLPQGFDTHLIELAYGHQISGRWALNFGAGPQITIIKNPLSGTDTSHSWTADGSLNYHYQKESVALTFIRGNNNGGGVLAGAFTDNVRGDWSTEFARHWTFSLDPGFAHNRSLPQTTAGSSEVTFNAAYVGASVSRKFGRNTSMFFTYNFQNQRSNAAPCSTGNCRSGLHRHVLGFGFDFHPRQITVD